MGAAAISKLPERLDRETVKKLVPPEFFDEARFDECAEADGTVSREVLGQRGAALERLSHAARAREAEGGDDAGKPSDNVLEVLQSAMEADPSFWTATQAYTGALAAADRVEEAVEILLSFASEAPRGEGGMGEEAKQFAQRLLVNAAVNHMRSRDFDSALEFVAHAEALGGLPSEALVMAHTARYHQLRSVLMANPLGGGDDSRAGFSELRSKIEEHMSRADARKSSDLQELLRQVEATEALAAGFSDLSAGNVAAAAANLEMAADGGEVQARGLAADAYLRAAVEEFEAFTRARQQLASEKPPGAAGISGLAPAPPALTRAISDGGASTLGACEAAASRATAVARTARLEGEASGLEAAFMERLGQVERVAGQILQRVNAVRKMDEELRESAPDVARPATMQARLPLQPASMSCGTAGDVSQDVEDGEDVEEAAAADLEPDLAAMDSDKIKRIIVQMFKTCDLNRDGYIGADELRQVIELISPGEWSNEQLDRLLTGVDKNKDGRIDYIEFTAWVCGEVSLDSPDDAAVLKQARKLLLATNWDAIGARVARLPPKKEKTAWDLKVEASLKGLAETMASLEESKQTIARAEAKAAEAFVGIAESKVALEKKMEEASSALDVATAQVAVAMGHKAAIGMSVDAATAQVAAALGDKFRAGNSTVPPPPRPKASWKRPDATARREAARAPKEKEIPAWFRPCECFEPIAIPEPGEWLSEHKEPGQNFKSFERVAMRARPHGHVTVIELLIIGPWPENAPPLEALQRYCSAFFSGCGVRVARESMTIAQFAAQARCGMEGQLQICINEIFDVLLKRRPERDVLCTVGVTMADIYTIKDGVAWNFVFGTARIMDGVGVFSFSRYYPSGQCPLRWTGAAVDSGAYDSASCYSEEAMDAAQRSRMLRSACKVLAHETCHIFGIKHCIYYQCLMCGTNHLEEGEKKPPFLCPVDLRKLQNSLGFDVASRYQALHAFCAEFGWAADAAWIEQRLAVAADGEKEASAEAAADKATASPAAAGAPGRAGARPGRRGARTQSRAAESTGGAARVVATGDGPWHGHVGDGHAWGPPFVAAASDAAARPGYDAYDASEYVDQPDVLQEKVRALAELWRRSSNCVVYTGAGLSTAAGLHDYASKADGSVAPHRASTRSTGSRLDLLPTLAHHGLAALGEKGMVSHWIQQNHDRLAQKAGYPQAKLNEIHGAWGDNKNPVKMMDDVLRKDLFNWLEAWRDRADMCMTLGTSLCGMNADQLARACATKYPESGGLVVVGLQRSVYDGVASLRIWGLCDDVIQMVCRELAVPCPDKKASDRGKEWVRKHPGLKYNTPLRKASDPM